MNREFEEKIQQLAVANFNEIEKFINLLVSLTKSGLARIKNNQPLIQKIQKMQHTLVHVLFILKQTVYDTILKKQTHYIALHASKIMDQDANFFYSNPQIFGELNPEDVSIFRDIYADAGLNDEEKDQIWASLKTFLILSGIYQGKFREEIAKRFLLEMDTFFDILSEYCTSKTLLTQAKEVFDSDSEDYAPEVALMCISCQLLPYKDLIENRDRAFFKTGFLARNDLQNDWLEEALPKNLNQEASNYVWGYLLSLVNLSSEFVSEPERYITS